MRSRLGFSIAAVLNPDIFIIDEALSTGDLAFRQKASERIQDMMESAKAVIIVSHSLNFIEKICTRAIWMENGQVVYDGVAEEAAAKYRESPGTGTGKKTKKKRRKRTKATATKTENTQEDKELNITHTVVNDSDPSH